MPPIRWKNIAGVPSFCAAVFSALQCDQPETTGLLQMTDRDWLAALDFCDRAQLTLILHQRCGSSLPAWVEERIRGNIDANRRRCRRLQEEYFQVAERLQGAGVSHVVLKGFTHVPLFVPASEYRLQADLDLLLDRQDLDRTRQILVDLGFESEGGDGHLPTDHLPPFVRKTGWRWQGDFYDPERPAVIELHYRLWDETTELFDIEGLVEFAKRQQSLVLDGQPLPSFCPADQLGYACLHAVRHLLRGDLKVFHIYELAYFLHGQADREELWRDWRRTHSTSLRQLEAIACSLAEAWFGCQLPGSIQLEIRQLPAPVTQWLGRYAAAPVASVFHPNKDELWLHFSLLSNWKDRLRVTRRRLVPLTLPGHVEANFVPAAKFTPGLWARKWARYARYLLSRVVFHTRALVSILAGGATWWLVNRQRAAERRQVSP
jgi:hypothetical protein